MVILQVHLPQHHYIPQWTEASISCLHLLHFTSSFHYPERISLRLQEAMCCHSVSLQESKTLLWVVWPCCSGFWLILGRIPTGVLWPVWSVCRTWLFIIIISAYEHNLHRSVLAKKHLFAVWGWGDYIIGSILTQVFFLSRIHSMQDWIATLRHRVTSKRSNKRLSIEEIWLERTFG